MSTMLLTELKASSRSGWQRLACAHPLPNFRSMNGDVFFDVKAQSYLSGTDLEHCDFEHALETHRASDHNRFLAFSGQYQHGRTSVFKHGCAKKAGVVKHHEVFSHAGLLV